MKIAFTGGGTAGHIFPGLAVVEEISKLDPTIEVSWIGSKKANEKKMVEDYNVPFYSIPTGKLRRYFSLENVIDIFKIFAGVVKSIYLLLKLKPNLVFSKGGFVAVPPCFAAKLLGIPVCIHESDFSTGLATKLTSRFAKRIFLSYAETTNQFSPALQSRCLVTGTPVRNRFFNASPEKGRRFLNPPYQSQKVLLVIGGSLGAKQINDLIKETCVFLTEAFFVVHQLGSANFETASEIQTKLKTEAPNQLQNYAPFEFINEEMADVLSCADIVISRAGANSLWEIISMHKPAILIPLGAESSRGDQIENAKYFAAKNCVQVLEGKNATSQALETTLRDLIANPEKLTEMSEAAKTLVGAPASKKIASELYSIIEQLANRKTKNEL